MTRRMPKRRFYSRSSPRPSPLSCDTRTRRTTHKRMAHREAKFVERVKRVGVNVSPKPTFYHESRGKPETLERMRRLQEILDTEREYVADLRLVCEVHRKRLEGTLKREEMSLIFGNLLEIYEIHKMLLSKLMTARKIIRDKAGRDEISSGVLISAEEAQARVFEEMAPFLRAYTAYCKGYQAAIEYVSGSAKISKLLKGKPGGDDLASLLIKPVQRLCRYPLFFEELLKHAQGDARQRLEAALGCVRSACEAVNSAVAAAESMAMVVKIYQDHFDASEDVGTLVTPTRTFLSRGPIILRSDDYTAELHYFLFNDLLLLAAPRETSGTDTKFDLHHRLTLVDLDVKDAISLDKVNVIYLRYQNRTGCSYSPIHDGPKFQNIAKANLSFETPPSTDGNTLRDVLHIAASQIKVLHSDVESRRNGSG